MAALTPQETVKAVLDALHSSSADFVVQILGTPGGDYFCRRWNSGLQEPIQRDIATQGGNAVRTTFGVEFLEAPKVVLTPNNILYNNPGWFSAPTPREITTTSFLLVRNTQQNLTIVFIATGRWK